MIREHPNYFWGYICYGDVLYELGDEKAEELYTRAIEFADEDEMDVIYERFGLLYDNAEEKVREVMNKIADPKRIEKYKAYRKAIARSNEIVVNYVSIDYWRILTFLYLLQFHASFQLNCCLAVLSILYSPKKFDFKYPQTTDGLRQTDREEGEVHCKAQTERKN